jgi:hypothetical protein
MNTEKQQDIEGDDLALLYCTNADDLDRPHPESVKIMGDCGHLVWMSPSTKDMYDNPDLKTRARCSRCVPREELRNLLKQGLFRHTPASKQELLDSGMPEPLVEALYNLLGVKPMTEEEYDKLGAADA